jgi:hypothetical protein
MLTSINSINTFEVPNIHCRAFAKFVVVTLELREKRGVS